MNIENLFQNYECNRQLIQNTAHTESNKKGHFGRLNIFFGGSWVLGSKRVSSFAVISAFDVLLRAGAGHWQFEDYEKTCRGSYS